MKPLIHPTSLSGIQELLQLNLELGSFQHINLVFIFSERANTVFQILLKYNLVDKVNFIADPHLKIHDDFQVNKVHKKITESNQRNSKVIYLKSNEIINSIEFSREIP